MDLRNRMYEKFYSNSLLTSITQSSENDNLKKNEKDGNEQVVNQLEPKKLLDIQKGSKINLFQFI